MAMERRRFIRNALTCSAGAAVAGILPVGCWGGPLLEITAPVLFRSLLNFGGKVLEDTAQSTLEDWLKKRLAAPSPPATTFSDAFNPTYQIVVDGDSFFKRTKVQDRSLLVNNLPNLVHSGQASPFDYSHVNAPEMDELADTRNKLLWTECGCQMVRLPINSQARRPATQSSDEYSRFKSWVRKSPYQLADLPGDTPLKLDYVRDFCRCDEKAPLLGFGYHRTDQPQEVAAAGRFAVVSWG